MKLKEYLTENYDWTYYIDEGYLTLADRSKQKSMSQDELFNLFKDFIYKLPKKYSNKKQIFDEMRSDKIKFNRKEVNNYIEGLDESRLEELVGIINDSLKKWGYL